MKRFPRILDSCFGAKSLTATCKPACVVSGDAGPHYETAACNVTQDRRKRSRILTVFATFLPGSTSHSTTCRYTAVDRGPAQLFLETVVFRFVGLPVAKTACAQEAAGQSNAAESLGGALRPMRSPPPSSRPRSSRKLSILNRPCPPASVPNARFTWRKQPGAAIAATGTSRATPTNRPSLRLSGVITGREKNPGARQNSRQRRVRLTTIMRWS